MADLEHAVFVSYGWGGESEDIINQIDQALQSRGITLVRDKRDLGYKGSIGEFMERIGRGHCVIVVISDKYLRSPNCMFELVEIAKHKDFYDRVFPIVLRDADIYNPVNRIKYIKYWEEKLKELDQAMKSVSSANLQGIREEIDSYDEIRDRISGLTSTLKDMNTLTPEMHRESDFNELYAAIEKRLRESAGSVVAKAAQETIKIQTFEPETILIPAGSFLMGSPSGVENSGHETPQHEVILSEYRIGKYPVTNAQYEEFVRQARRLVTPAMRWDGQTVPRGLEQHPVSGVTWYEALAYCEWLSEQTGRKYSLPNEAQWEKACRGGQSTLFPWGNEFDPKRSNHACSALAAVHAYPAQNEFGCFDFVGNVRQWTCTLWGEKRIVPDPIFAYPWREDRRNDLSANRQIRRVVRGSSFSDDQGALRCSSRSGQLPDDRGFPEARHGFRVVMLLS
jgi:formylglycine-generating enzyme required for sulfatase activity